MDQMMANNPFNKGGGGRAFATSGGLLLGLGALAMGINSSLFNGKFGQFGLMPPRSD